MRKIAFQAAAMLALVSSAQLLASQTRTAQDQANPCLTRPELRAMVAYSLPTVLASTIDTCTPRLAPDSYLRSRAPQLLSALEGGRPDAWPMARRALPKIGDERDKDSIRLLASLPEAAARPIVEAVIIEKLGPAIKPESCGDIDRIMAPLEPLPAANLIDVMTEGMAVAGRSGRHVRVCQGS